MSLSADKLIKLGQEASFAYFTEGVPLEQTIVKLASRYNLNPEQIKRVCEIANKETMIQIYKTASDHTTEFDLVDSKNVIKKLSSTPQILAPVSSDYLSPPPACVTSNIKIASDFFGEPEYKKMDSFNSLVKKADSVKIQLKQVNDEMLLSQVKIAGLKEKLIEVIKSALGEGHTLQEIMEVAKRAIPGQSKAVSKLFEEILPKIKSSVANKPGFLGGIWSKIKGFFKGAEAVDAELIDRELSKLNGSVPMKIINGESKLFRVLRALYDEGKAYRKRKRFTHDLQSKLKILSDKIDSKKPEEGMWF